MGSSSAVRSPLVLLLVLSVSTPALAGPDEERIQTGPGSAKEPRVEKDGAAEEFETFMSLAVGAKVSFGGNLWTSSKNVPSWPLVPFDGSAGGWAAGGGLQIDLRILWGYLGLEFDVLIERSTMWTEITHSMIENNFESEWATTKWFIDWTNVRLPLLLKAYAPIGWARFTIAIGPEFVVGTGANAQFSYLQLDSDADPVFLQEATDAGTKNFHAKVQTDTYLCVGLGLFFPLGKTAINFDVRYAYNFTQPRDYEDRANVDENGAHFVASSSMDLRLMLGISYNLDF